MTEYISETATCIMCHRDIERLGDAYWRHVKPTGGRHAARPDLETVQRFKPMIPSGRRS